MSDDPIITISDMRRVGFCVSGVRRWFAAHNLDFKDLLKNGIPASKLLATEDALGKKVVDFVMGGDHGRGR